MNTGRFLRLAVITVFLSMSISCSAAVREAAVAGQFYPSDPEALKAMVEKYYARAENTPVEGELLALISPHAGYAFSGQVAAYGYKHLKAVDTVILIGPSHHTDFTGASVYAKGGFRTPLGTVKIDDKLAKSLINEDAGVSFYQKAHDREHSLEVQLPFLQVVFKDFKIVPIVIGRPTRESFEHLTEKLAAVMAGRGNTLVIASTDLSHYHDYESAVRMDGKVIEALSRLSIRDVERLITSGEGELCGAYPTMVVVEAARKAGANTGVAFKYANSGDVTSDRQRVVGYLSMGLYKSPLTREDKEELLALARNTIVEFVKNGKVREEPAKNPRLKTDGAAFVTIKRGGQLRGCIGHILPMMPLYMSVLRNAIAASSQDPRFQPMTEDELEEMDVEISIMSPLLKIKDVGEIEVGKHGLYITKDDRRGVLLPQVPVEFGWDRDEFLKQLCHKAGLPEDGWKSGATIYKFSADIIH